MGGGGGVGGEGSMTSRFTTMYSLPFKQGLTNYRVYSWPFGVNYKKW